MRVQADGHLRDDALQQHTAFWAQWLTLQPQMLRAHTCLDALPNPCAPLMVGLFPVASLGPAPTDGAAAAAAMEAFLAREASTSAASSTHFTARSLPSPLTPDTASLLRVLLHACPKSDSAGLLRATCSAISCGVLEQQVMQCMDRSACARLTQAQNSRACTR